MTMINCPECGHSVSSTAAACPNCGHVLAGTTSAESAHDRDVRRDDTRRRVGPGRWLAGLFFLALIVLIALWYFDIVNFT